MQLTIEPRSTQDVVILDLKGRIVAGQETDSLRAQIKEMLAAKETKIILNFRDVTRIDSTGIGMLVECVILAAKAAAHIKLVSLPRLIYNILSTHRLLQAFEINSTEEEALSSFTSPSA
jgi:anti-anti-sigma factor